MSRPTQMVSAQGVARRTARGTVLARDDEVSPFTLLVVARGGKVLTARSYLSDEETLARLELLG